MNRNEDGAVVLPVRIETGPAGPPVPTLALGLLSVHRAQVEVGEGEERAAVVLRFDAEHIERFVDDEGEACVIVPDFAVAALTASLLAAALGPEQAAEMMEAVASYVAAVTAPTDSDTLH